MKPEIEQYFPRRPFDTSVGFIRQAPMDDVETVEEFLARGGEITHVPAGVSGVDEYEPFTGTGHLAPLEGRNNP